MKKWMLLICTALILVLAACGKTDSATDEKASSKDTSDTIIYQSSKGDIEVPSKPERVVVLSSYAGDLIKLGVNIVGVDSWSMDNPNFKEGLAHAEIVTNEDLEKILELEPDLIIGLDNVNNADKLKEIAPTVLFTYGEYDYLQQHIEVGKVVNQEEKAAAWAEDFKKRTQEIGKDIKSKIGEDTTITVAENYEKQMYVFGDAWGRGTEILYQGMGLKMPQSVIDQALKPGYAAISQEVLDDYVGDYLLLNLWQDTSFTDSEWYNNIEAVKRGQVLLTDGPAFYFNDALSLEYQLASIEKFFLK
ncbi:ABC transporter substrate-binding protein [Bacillus sp. FJAT-27916]|uniref:ABC transporter substrate-binding protein n=1 Tax=Bacillaceae TaxID=186817 RepID=UPI0006707A40|nr:ABC transporter substrate-binding protein [Bacillus sp. FJAT-27916]KMY45747.1 ABC transporter substrate-binding protein [Bacillus sp. FJAT-27916]